jgi:cytochrome c-type biogenesis protein CcmE
VVAEGSIAGDGRFTATTVLAKHDENYMPKEVVEALKARGEWQRDGATAENPQ